MNYKTNFWAVGSTLGGKNYTKQFLANNEWYDGHAENGDEQYKIVLEKVKIGDILIMKSSATKGPKRGTTFTKVKAIGQVVQRINGHKFQVKWFPNDALPMDFDHISYRKTIEPLREDDIHSYLSKIMKERNNQEIIDILEYKKQIILQGPPGTGKTYTAEQIAKRLTETENVSDPLALVDDFYKNFNLQKDEILKGRKERAELRDKFLQLFPKEVIQDLNLDQYCIGTGERENFCWWIERGLKSLGYYFPGSSKSYRIYWSKAKEEYKKNGSLKNKEDEEAMKIVANHLHGLVVDQDYDRASQFFGPSLILKILNTYYPEDYLPINAENYLNHALALLNIDYQGLDFVQKNKKLVKFHQEKRSEFNKDVQIDEFAHFLLQNFNLKEGEKKDSGKVISRGAYELVQFHPAYSYEDFVRGIVAEIEDKTPAYNVKNKILAEFSQRAIDNPKAKFVLIIDEINRANLPAVLGELIYALEYRGKAVNSLYELDDDRSIVLPENLLIIGTMNTADRSVGHIDYAIRRRFSFIEMLPDENLVPDFAKGKFKEVESLFTNKFLHPDFIAKDVQIGHSYFMGEEKHLDMKMKNEVVPILREYIKDGVLREEADDIIKDL